MPDDRHARLLRYETWAAECEMLARVATDRLKQNQYERLAVHYRYLAASFREALVMYGVGLAKLTLH
jgi:hypothetical protein